MDSFSKIPLSAERAAPIVARHFGSQRSLKSFEELREGYFNAAALLELDDGQKLVLKATPPDEVKVMRYEKDLMRAEVESMRLVAACTAVPVPQIQVYDTSRSLLPSDFFIMTCLPGVPFHKLRHDLPPEAQQQVERQMGRLTREMSVITGPAFGLWSQPCAPGVSWRDCFTAMLRNVILDGQDIQVELDQPYEQFYDRLERHFHTLETITQPRLVHWDLWDGNVFVDPQSLQITGLIDFERVMWADPLIEAVFGRPDPQGAYVAGYGGPLFEDPAEVTRRLLYNAYLFLIMTIEGYYRRYPTKDLENWARARLKETLDLLEAR
jgi:aminoglycoside phosphotransferase (APT) family kinase protein